MKDLAQWQLINKSLAANIPCALLIVVESTGSSPGKEGNKIALNTRGDLIGTIGGGSMEDQLVEKGREVLKIKDYTPRLLRQSQEINESGTDSQMICSGSQMVMILPINKCNRENIETLIMSFEQEKSGSLCISPNGIEFIPDLIRKKNIKFTRYSKEEWLYEENIGCRNQIYIIGGGHISFVLSRIISTLDFKITVFDDNSVSNTFNENHYADNKIICNYSKIEKLISDGPQNYLLIATSDQEQDERILRRLINKKCAYLGILGNRSKLKRILQDLEKEKISKEKLDFVSAPAGLPINSLSSAETAVSIAAEIIEVKNSLKPVMDGNLTSVGTNGNMNLDGYKNLGYYNKSDNCCFFNSGF